MAPAPEAIAGPGPGAYTQVEDVGTGAAYTFALSDRRGLGGEEEASSRPGPGAYNLAEAPRGLAFTMAARPVPGTSAQRSVVQFLSAYVLWMLYSYGCHVHELDSAWSRTSLSKPAPPSASTCSVISGSDDCSPMLMACCIGFS